MRTFSLATLLTLATLAGCAAPSAHFGEPMRLPETDTLPLEKVLAQPTEFDGKFIRVSGTVSQVCEAMGCWMEMKDAASGKTLFVKFTCPTEGRLIPMDAIGHQAVVEGKLDVTQISEDEARHYKEEAGASAAEVAKIVGPQKQLRMGSPAALVIGIRAPAKSVE